MNERRSLSNLLIVEDDLALGVSLLGILRKAGYEGRTVATGKEALEVIRAKANGFSLDAALVDIRLPDMNGLEVLRELKRTDPEVGVIVMTGNTDTETAIEALNEGAFAYVQKPYNVDEVKTILARSVERRILLRERRALMAQLKETNLALERRVLERTRDLQNANLQLANTIGRLREANEIKAKFISNVSHELRTPLQAINGCADTLLAKVGKLDAEKQKQFLGMVQRGARRLSTLISDMLNFSKIQARSMELELESFDLRNIVKEVIKDLEAEKEQIQFDMGFDGDGWEMTSDQERVQKVVGALLANAQKYSPDGATVHVNGRQNEKEIEVRVIDSGPGIPETEREKIFEEFYRSSDVINMKSPGTGLGLTITKAIVTALGGKIWVEPAEVQGSIFVFIIPKKVDKKTEQALTDAANEQMD